MRILFDTHAFIWWDSEPDKLPAQVLDLCQNRENVLLFSVVSAWEIQIKAQLGKLKFTLPLAEVIENQQQTNHLEVLPIALPHVLTLDRLPMHHKDPFDRLLLAQARVEDAILVSNDPVFAAYSNKIVW